MKKLACKKDKMLTTGNQCPLCKGEALTQSWKGRLFILNPEKSLVAKKVEIESEGEYAIKVS